MSDAFAGLTPLAFRRLAHMVGGADFKTIARWMCRPYDTFLRYGDTGVHGRRCKADVVAHVALLAALSRRGLLAEIFAEAQTLAEMARNEARSLRTDLGLQHEEIDNQGAVDPCDQASKFLLEEAIKSLVKGRAELARARAGAEKEQA
ncbi:hypothetical protein GE253_23060 [Niveispirillum sp. SYP-B3756]|uniref:hypothetical protein n=1 Tax=Niveispirillum sp. SYP-B3756 TaxID=2662178 RepID=UPI00129189FA|nr:hypothetical protein [Niveispirillum sp. SYP-B3756]MQP68202.1 hypothetical protein [Niveispirillum sp. SYP-B3756]